MSLIIGILGTLFLGAVVIVVGGITLLVIAGVCVNAWADAITGGLFKE